MKVRNLINVCGNVDMDTMIVIENLEGFLLRDVFRNAIKYAIDNRNEQKSIANFERIFGYKYDRYYFTNEIIIEEIARVVKKFETHI